MRSCSNRRAAIIGVTATVLGAVSVGAVALSPVTEPPRQGGALHVEPTRIADRAVVNITGHDSLVKKPDRVRITSREQWEVLWERHRGEDAPKNVNGWPNPPRVDFERYLVIAVFVGDSSNCGGLGINAIDDLGDAWRIRYDANTFQTAGPPPDGGAVRVTPYAFWIVPRTTKPIILENNVQGLIGRPPKWRELHRFPALES